MKSGKHVSNGHADLLVAEVEGVLRQAFPKSQIKVYRYNSASIRARVVDEKFAGKSIAEREAMLRPVVAKLSDEAAADLTVLLTIGKDEARRSLMSLEFEEPLPSA